MEEECPSRLRLLISVDGNESGLDLNGLGEG